MKKSLNETPSTSTSITTSLNNSHNNTSPVSPGIKQVARKAGQLVQKASSNVNQYMEQNHVYEKASDKVSQLLQASKQKYEETNQGRSADSDISLLKNTAIATAGVVSVMALPAVAVGVAVAGTLVVAAKENATAIQHSMEENYVAVTGRDVEKDKIRLKEALGTAKETATVLKNEFQQGMLEEKNS